MQKIDEKLLNFVILSEKDCVYNCIVYYYDKTKTQAFFNANNIKILKDLNFINAFAVCFNSENILKTASLSYVCYVSSTSSVSALMDTSKKILGIAGLGYTGKGTTIAFIDTGINPHLDFTLKKNKLVKFCDFVNQSKRPYDDNGHGTFVSGVACGSGLLSSGKYCGIAKDANIISLKALDQKGEANAVTILEAMDWIYNNFKLYDISVVCMSFGSEPLGAYDPIMKGAEKLWQSGLVVVCAAGNSGPEKETIKSPGISRRIITVGGLNDNRNDDGTYNEQNFDVAEFSSRGPAFGKVKPDLIAPSVNITSCDSRGGYRQMSGTSVAAPMVAGLAAIIKEKYPNVSPEQMKKFLLYNAKSINNMKIAEGYGVANLSQL